MKELERTARLIAAHKMALVKDPFGLRLPDDLWRQAIPSAEHEIAYRKADSEDLDIFADHQPHPGDFYHESALDYAALVLADCGRTQGH